MMAPNKICLILVFCSISTLTSNPIEKEVICLEQTYSVASISPVPSLDLSLCCQAGNTTAYIADNPYDSNCFTADYTVINPQCGFNAEAIRCCECCYQGRIQAQNNQRDCVSNTFGDCRTISEACCRRERSDIYSGIISSACVTSSRILPMSSNDFISTIYQPSRTLTPTTVSRSSVVSETPSVVVICSEIGIERSSDTASPTPLPTFSPCCQAGNMTAYIADNPYDSNCFTADYTVINPQCGFNAEAIRCCECCYQGRIQAQNNQRDCVSNTFGDCRTISEACCKKEKDETSSVIVPSICVTSTIYNQINTITPTATPLPDLSPCCQAGNKTAFISNDPMNLQCFTEDYAAVNPQCEHSTEAIKCCECCYQGRIQAVQDIECSYTNAVGNCRIVTEFCCQNERKTNI